MRQHLSQRQFGKELERGNHKARLEQREDAQSVRETRQAQHHHAARRWRGAESQFGLDHEPQGAFGTDEQVAQVVSGGVLHEPLIEIENVALAGDDAKARDPIPRQAVANHFDSASVGGDVAADLAGTGRREVHGIAKPLVGGEILQGARDDARLATRDAASRIETENSVHAVEGDDHFAIARHRAAGKPRAPTGRHQREAVFVGEANQRRHFVDGLRKDDRGRCDREAARPIAAPGAQIVFRGRHPRCRKQGFEFFDHDCSTSTAGSGLPSRSARKAPPPVER